jgi:PAS domain S-box-containing protein
MNQHSSAFVRKVLLRQSITSVRLVIALFTISSALIKLLYNHFLPNLADIDILRWSITGLGCVFFATTFITYKRGLVVVYFSFFLYLLTVVYLIAFVVLNHFDANAVTILILVIGVSTIVMNSLFYYAVQSFVILAASLFTFMNYTLSEENMMALINLIIALGAFGIVISVRLNLISSVQNSHANLEKLNVLSIVANKAGEIVFISPSVQQLLGYDPKDLVKDGWWSYLNLSNGWINRDYILNYPNKLPKEIVSIETKVITKDGRTVWLSWANSILPNGNYMGVALDVTKYKNVL